MAFSLPYNCVIELCFIKVVILELTFRYFTWREEKACSPSVSTSYVLVAMSSAACQTKGFQMHVLITIMLQYISSRTCKANPLIENHYTLILRPTQHMVVNSVHTLYIVCVWADKSLHFSIG